MRITDNVRTMLSTTAGLAGGGIGMVGWAAKAATPTSASLAAKGTTASIAAVAVGGTTFALLHGLLPTVVNVSSTELTLHSSLVANYVAATYAGLCTALSYTLGVGRDTGKRPSKNDITALVNRGF